MPDTELESIVYVSSAVRLLSLEEIGHLLSRARERNREYSVTGVLLYIGGNFMQYIEGPRESLDVIYKIIQQDKLHTGIIQISREAAEGRQFGDWSMAFQTREHEGYVGSPSERAVINAILEPPAGNSTSAQIVLRSFWERSSSQRTHAGG